MASSSESYVCSVCFASFRHLKHLRRHSISLNLSPSEDSEDRPHRCIFCNACFKRRDILKKHFKTCPVRIKRGEAIPDSLLPGKKMKSCDRCSLAKKACDQNTPCSACAAKQQSCTYQRAAQSANSEQETRAFFPPADDDLDFLDDFLDETQLNDSALYTGVIEPEWYNWDHDLQSSEPLSFNEAESMTTASYATPWKLHTNRERFGFLLHFSRTSGLKKVFNYSRMQKSGFESARVEQDPTSRTYSETSGGPEGWTPSEPSFEHLSGSENSPQECFSLLLPSADQDMTEYNANFGIERMVEWLDDPLFPQTQDLWYKLRSVMAKTPQMQVSGIETSPKAEARCLQFFCPSNLRRFIALYWSQWNPHCPILHKPTFDAACIPSLLLGPIALMGACMSPYNQDIANAKEWLDIAEEMVFSNALLSVDITERRGADIGIAPLKVIQAAYIICLLQNWEGNDTVKRRIRQQRYATVIAAARDVGLSSGNHSSTESSDFIAFNWYNFVVREEAVRTFTFVFLLDNAFMIFNNAPPRMVLHEMDLALTCSEEAFQADNAEECWRMWHSSLHIGLPLPKQYTLTEAIELIAQSEFDSERYHTVLFQQRTLFLCLPTSLHPIKLALDRWRSAWESVQQRALERRALEPWQEVGFFSHSDEYALLALARLDNLQQRFPLMPSTVHGQVLSSKNVSERLDDTTMSQFSDLMLSLSVLDK